MQLEIIIAALRERCPSFANRVAGAAQFKALPEAAALAMPCAFVIPLEDQPAESKAANNVRQPLNDSFGVIVAISNLPDEKGQGSTATVHSMRAELWAALLGWRPHEDYDGVVYEGGQLLSVDRARLWYQFEFSAAMDIASADGWQDTELAGLPNFEGMNFRIDLVDLYDPNLAESGPDGRTEFEVHVPPEPETLPD